MNNKIAHLIYSVLVNEAGASERWRFNFVTCFEDPGSREYRFCGDLGFGGKFWFDRGEYKITCYREDENADTLRIIDRVNGLLRQIFEEEQTGALYG